MPEWLHKTYVIIEAAALAVHPDTVTGALLLLVGFVVLGAVLSGLIRKGVRMLLERDRDERIDRTAATFLTQFASVFVWIVVLTFYAHVVPALDRLGTALLASVSIASVVIGLAAQSALSNLIAGVLTGLHRVVRFEC